MNRTISIQRLVILCFGFTIFLMPGTVFSQLLLNEMMSSNVSTIKDQFNNFSDWIEIYNSGESAIELSDYWLSDDSALLQKWNFPNIELAPDDYLLIFASGQDIAASSSNTYWHTVVDSGDEWKYLVPSSDIDDEWKNSVGSASTWLVGPSGIGYSDGDDATIIPATISLYMQKEFEVSELNELVEAALYMDYDDGFIAYLNGSEIARSASMGSPGTSFGFDEAATAQHEATMYNGGNPESYPITDKLHLFQEGKNILAIEIHNISLGSSDLSAIPFLYLGFPDIRAEYTYGCPYISDTENYSHTNFRIKSGGEKIFLSNATGVIDSIDNVMLLSDYSYGRVPQDTIDFGYYELATPGWENGNEYATEFFTDSVYFISSGKDYDSYQRVTITSDKENDLIYYTLTGSEPDENSQLYTSPITINNTTVIRARIYRPGKLPGPVSTKTFFTDQGHELPVIAVTMSPFDLYDYNSGIYVMGPYAESDNPYFGANFWQDWEKPAHIEIYDRDHNLLLSQLAGTKIYGAWSRARPQKSQAFYARSIYGDGSFSYPLFSEKPMQEYENFVLRNGGNDYCMSMFRDAFNAYLESFLNIDHQAYEPYVMYLNGEYYGMMNMREKINENFIAGNHNVHPEDVNILELDGQVIDGSERSYNHLRAFISVNDMSDEDNYAYVNTLMDVQNFINFWVFNVYIDNKDWPGNNNKFWSLDVPGSLYRWIAFDTDFGYSIYDNSAYSYNTLQFGFSEGEITWANQEWATLFVRRLIENEDFKRRFINAFADQMNSIFSPDFAYPVLDSFKLRISDDVGDHFSRWQGSVGYWNGEINKIRVFLEERPYYMKKYIMERFDIDDTEEIVIDVSNTAGGYVRINATDISSYPFEGTYFEDVPIDLKAIPEPGYKFFRWEGKIESSYPEIQYDMKVSGEFTAVFEKADYQPNIVINEINYASHSDKNTEDWLELYNFSEGPVDLKGWTVWDKSSGEFFEISKKTILQPKEYFVLSRSLPDFKHFYPELMHLDGNLPYGINNDGDGVALIDPENNIHDVVDFLNVNPWPEEANGSGATIELLNPRFDNSLAESWKASKENTGTPGVRNSQYEILDNILEDVVKDIEIVAFPSPFSEALTISIDLQESETVSIEVYSIVGAMIMTIDNREFSAGRHKLNWTPDAMTPSGIYLIKVRAGSSTKTLKIVYK